MQRTRRCSAIAQIARACVVIRLLSRRYFAFGRCSLHEHALASFCSSLRRLVTRRSALPEPWLQFSVSPATFWQTTAWPRRLRLRPPPPPAYSRERALQEPSRPIGPVAGPFLLRGFRGIGFADLDSSRSRAWLTFSKAVNIALIPSDSDRKHRSPTRRSAAKSGQLRSCPHSRHSPRRRRGGKNRSRTPPPQRLHSASKNRRPWPPSRTSAR